MFEWITKISQEEFYAHYHRRIEINKAELYILFIFTLFQNTPNHRANKTINNIGFPTCAVEGHGDWKFERLKLATKLNQR